MSVDNPLDSDIVRLSTVYYDKMTLGELKKQFGLQQETSYERFLRIGREAIAKNEVETQNKEIKMYRYRLGK